MFSTAELDAESDYILANELLEKLYSSFEWSLLADQNDETYEIVRRANRLREERADAMAFLIFIW